MISWFDQPHRFRRRSGEPFIASPLDITDGYDSDPVVAIEAGHPFARIGFEFLLRDIFQAALAPATGKEWVALLAAPPSPDELRQRLEPYRRAFSLDAAAGPAFQVRPSPERLAEQQERKPAKGGGRGRKATAPPPGDEGDEEEGAGELPVATLLPDLPSGEAVKQGADFFVKRDEEMAIGAGAILPVIYAHMVLVPPAAGGYFGLPHGADSVKFQLVGNTLWQTLWLNVLARDAAEYRDAPWPAPVDATVFPWLDPTLADLPLGRRADGAARPVGRAEIHPAALLMARRYLLGPAEQGRCALTGLEGAVYRGFRRWPKGLQYQPQGWWHPAMAVKETAAAKPEDGPRFVRARGPLRFDDWVGVALFEQSRPASGAGKKDKAQVTRLPPVLRHFHHARHADLDAFRMAKPAQARVLMGGEAGGSVLFSRTGWRVRAFAQFYDGKAAAGTTGRELPVWHLPEGGADMLAHAVVGIMEKLGEMSRSLRIAARIVATGGHKDAKTKIADDLADALLAGLDASVLALPDRLAEYLVADDDEAWNERRAVCEREILNEARGLALGLFDGAFPIVGADKTAQTIAVERGKLHRALISVGKRAEASPP